MVTCLSGVSGHYHWDPPRVLDNARFICTLRGLTTRASLIQTGKFSNVNEDLFAWVAQAVDPWIHTGGTVLATV